MKIIFNKFLVLFFVVIISAKAQAIFAPAILDPYANAPLSAIVPLKSNKLKNIEVSISSIDPSQDDLVYKVGSSAINENGGVPIFGLYANHDNKISISALLCDELTICKHIEHNFTLRTKALEFKINAKSKISDSSVKNYFVLFSSPLGYAYALDSHANVRWVFKGKITQIEQASNHDFWVLGEDTLKRFSLIGKLNAQINPAFNINKISSISQNQSNKIYLAASSCAQAPCEENVDEILEIDNQNHFFNIFLSDILNSKRDSIISTINSSNCCLIEPKPLAQWAKINSISADADGIVISLENQSAIAKISHNGSLIWLFGASRGWGKNELRRLLKVQNTKRDRLNCNLDYCIDASNGSIFSYPARQRFVKILGHKNGNLILGVFDSARSADLVPNVFNQPVRAHIRVFEIDERRLSVREIFRSYSINSAKAGSIYGDLEHLQMFYSTPELDKFSVYSYDIDHPKLNFTHDGFIDFSLDFSKSSAKASNRLLLDMDIKSDIKSTMAFKLEYDFSN